MRLVVPCNSHSVATVFFGSAINIDSEISGGI